jgi:hypothetical protein
MKAAGQMLVPGRVMVVSTQKFPNNLAVILKTSEIRSEIKIFSCMIIFNREKKSEAFDPRLQRGNALPIIQKLRE